MLSQIKMAPSIAKNTYESVLGSIWVNQFTNTAVFDGLPEELYFNGTKQILQFG